MRQDKTAELLGVGLCLLFLISGCSGLFEFQGVVNVSPEDDAWRQGGALQAHLGFSEEAESPLIGGGASIKVEVTETYGSLEQGVHGFFLNELDERWALYGRLGGLAGMDPVGMQQFSLTTFLQFGSMYAVDDEQTHCISFGAHTQYSAIFDNALQHGPWFGLYVGYGDWWASRRNW